MDVDRAQVLTFRLSRHHLAQRLVPRSMMRAVAASGVQETPLRTASLALHARVAGVTLPKVDRALEHDKTLLTIWAMRDWSSVTRSTASPRCAVQTEPLSPSRVTPATVASHDAPAAHRARAPPPTHRRAGRHQPPDDRRRLGDGTRRARPVS
jgi:hypothetical protein